VSIRYGPHVLGRFDSGGKPLTGTKPKHGGKGGSGGSGENQKQVSSGSPTPLEIPQKTRDSHFPTRARGGFPRQEESANQKGGGLTAASL
jgi:hypothetical protein